MVFVRKEQWTNRELLALFNSYKSEVDWEHRSSKLNKLFSNERGKGFFSPKNCQAEFNNILSRPCPSHPAHTTGSYSHKAVIDIWVQHFENEIAGEDAKANELELVEMRRKAALVERLWSGKRSFTVQELTDMLEEARNEDAKREDQEQLSQVVSAYMARLKEVLHEKHTTPSSSTRLPATKRAPHSPRGGETAFRSPSPSRSPLKSPIRPIAEALREAQSPLKERRAEEMETNEATIKSESTESLFAINTSPKPKDLSLIATKIMLNIEQPEKKRGRGRPSKASQQAAQQRAAAAAASIDIPEKNGEQEAVHVGEKPISNVTEGESRPRRPSKPIELENKDNEIKVEDSPAGRHRGGRRNIVVDSPLISSGRRKRHHAGADIHDDSGGEETEDKKSRRHDAKESSVASDISLYAPSSAAQSTASLSGDSRTTSCQTDIAIQGVIWTHIEKKDRRSSSNRKNSSNRTETRDTSFINLNLTKDNFTQTGRVEFDKDDQVIVTFTSEERTFIRTITIEEREKKEEEWSDDDDMALSFIVKKSSANFLPLDDEESEERRLKSDGKREITVIYDTDKWLAQALAKRPGHFLDEGGSSNFGSPSKRARKEEKVKEENVQQKVVLMNMWRNVCSHRHSGIFSHPVNDKDAPGYSSTVRNRMDLQTLRKEIESGIVSTPTIMRHRLLLMYANAVMFNSTGHDVNIFAKDMAKDTLSEIMKMITDKQKTAGHSRRSKLPEEITPKLSNRLNSPAPPPQCQTSVVVEFGTPGNKRTVFKRTLGEEVRRRKV